MLIVLAVEEQGVLPTWPSNSSNVNHKHLDQILGGWETLLFPVFEPTIYCGNYCDWLSFPSSYLVRLFCRCVAEQLHLKRTQPTKIEARGNLIHLHVVFLVKWGSTPLPPNAGIEFAITKAGLEQSTSELGWKCLCCAWA